MPTRRLVLGKQPRIGSLGPFPLSDLANPDSNLKGSRGFYVTYRRNLYDFRDSGRL